MLKANIYIDQGTDFSLPIIISTSTSTPIDITGATIVGGMKSWYTSNTAYPFSFAVTNAISGQVTAKINANITATIPAGRYVYNISLKTAANSSIGVVEGIVTINPESF